MDSQDIAKLGPLASLAGVWEGAEGLDRAPSPTREAAETRYRERITFEPIGQVDNHEQVLHGLRYATTAWRSSDGAAFHEEVGYWLWDAKERQVLRCFIVPRGVSVLAGGTADAGAKRFSLVAEVGSATYGICSNRFLDAQFRTERYELEVTVVDRDAFSYREDTQLRIAGQAAVFHHTDENALRRVE